MDDAYNLSDILGLRVLLRLDPEFLVWLAGNIAARVVLLFASDRKKQPARLFRILGSCVRLNRAQDIWTPSHRTHLMFFSDGLVCCITRTHTLKDTNSI